METPSSKLKKEVDLAKKTKEKELKRKLFEEAEGDIFFILFYM